MNQEQVLFHAQAYIPTQPAQAIEEARISLAHEDPGRPESSFPPPRQGAQAGLSKTRFPRIGIVVPVWERTVLFAFPSEVTQGIRVTARASVPGESKQRVKPRARKT